jgi:agmatine/peptidylarginine deiminase
MGLFVALPQSGGSERTLQLDFGTNMEIMQGVLPAEWAQQSFVQLTWPHEGTDWAYMLEEVEDCFTQIASAIAARQRLLIVAPDVEHVKQVLQGKANEQNIRYFTCETNDTWARDHAFITVQDEMGPTFLDFRFNGWGMKFAACLDNQINRRLYASGLLHGCYRSCLDFVLEGGSIESDGQGTLLTTSTCLLAPNRNEPLLRSGIEKRLMSYFHLKQVLWLDHGYLAGDDTDSHVDTLARLCPKDTIVYVQCTDPEDEHYEELKRMEEQLQSFRTLQGDPYRLLPLPMADAIIEEGERLPATYANFLILNEAVLYPTYAQPENDRKAAEVLAEAFPGREIVPIDCRALIKQHGSLHCVTMQYPAGTLQEDWESK